MNPASGGASIDGSAYRYVVDLARHSPGPLDTTIEAWSAYGLALFALLMVLAWWRARRTGAPEALTALAVPVVVVVAYLVNDVLKTLVREDRPCQTLRVRTLEACPAHGDWSFPSNHAAIAAAAAVALLFVSRRLGALACLAAVAMAASRVWVGVHYPHDVLAGVVVGAVVALGSMSLLHARSATLAGRLATAPPLRVLLSAS
ncbi:phosphatase PAP2 family protein [Streptomyces cinerochromogenes]|uniref:phosphatase PAP2 family protein n=1 Tax=Streptomyces cinerochromogenes TaxID=66422 RepID=UPI001670087F|nr:phosphatase PAP2 family protein [Streptomyces cinerochromogenes]GGS63207.1 phosphatase PAP2 family protein [Streptomyces cinerochromogenes]